MVRAGESRARGSLRCPVEAASVARRAMKETLMKRVILALCALAALSGTVSGQRGNERTVNFYNWSDYIEPKVLEDFTKETGIKVKYDTFELKRPVGDQAARRPLRLRSCGSHRLLPGATDQGRRVPEARQEQAAQFGERMGRDREAACGLRSRQPARRQLHVGHDRHRLQREKGARSARRGRQDRQLGHRVQAGGHRQVQGLRRACAGRAGRRVRHGAQLSRPQSEHQGAGRP